MGGGGFHLSTSHAGGDAVLASAGRGRRCPPRLRSQPAGTIRARPTPGPESLPGVCLAEPQRALVQERAQSGAQIHATKNRLTQDPSLHRSGADRLPRGAGNPAAWSAAPRLCICRFPVEHQAPGLSPPRSSACSLLPHCHPVALFVIIVILQCFNQVPELMSTWLRDVPPTHGHSPVRCDY